MTAYYNEIDPFAANWLRSLIAAGHIPPGDVDERSIEDVTPADLAPYCQHHFFAGVGGWAYSLRLAGWPDDEPVWSGSCPCQSFSSAGKGKGFDDERHLWPAFFWLIQQCRPATIFGEQVASKSALKWWDLVASDLEGENYAAAAADLPAASVGAPHRRQRLFWVANTNSPGCQWPRSPQSERWQHSSVSAGRSQSDPVANPQSGERGQRVDNNSDERQTRIRGDRASRSSECCTASLMANAQSSECQRFGNSRHGRDGPANSSSVDHPHSERQQEQRLTLSTQAELASSKFTGNHWAGHQWITCFDEKQRAVKPGLRLLAHGIPGRLGRLRGYGNAITPQVAAEFIKAFQEAQG